MLQSCEKKIWSWSWLWAKFHSETTFQKRPPKDWMSCCAWLCGHTKDETQCHNCIQCETEEGTASCERILHRKWWYVFPSKCFYRIHPGFCDTRRPHTAAYSRHSRIACMASAIATNSWQPHAAQCTVLLSAAQCCSVLLSAAQCGQTQSLGSVGLCRFDDFVIGTCCHKFRQSLVALIFVTEKSQAEICHSDKADSDLS